MAYDHHSVINCMCKIHVKILWKISFPTWFFYDLQLTSKLWSCVQSWQFKQLHTAFSYLVQANTARVIFSWNDNDPTTPDGSDAMQHMVRGSASLNLLGGLTDPPPEPADTRSFTFTVNNVCVYCGVFHLAMNQRAIYKNNRSSDAWSWFILSKFHSYT